MYADFLSSSRWHLTCSVVVERPPILARALGPLEKKMEEMMMQVENERSLKSDHELRKDRDAEREERKKRGELDPSEVMPR